MRRQWHTRPALTSAAAMMVAAVAVGCGGESAAPAGPVPIVAVIDDVAYYPACSNEPVEVDGVTWYPVPDWGNDETARRYDEITSVAREQPATTRGFAPRVAPPGPGDDVGTLVVWADDVARFESDSGLVQWLVADELTYDWVC